MRKYLILGASSDLGMAFIRENDWQDDDSVVVQYHSAKNGEKLQKLLDYMQLDAELLQADFLDLASTKIFADRVALISGNFTHVIHIPALPISNNRFTEVGWDAAAAQINVQCRSVYMVLQGIIKGLCEVQGKIILVISSCSIGVPPRFLLPYVIAKYALLGFGKALASEYASKKVQVNMVSPSMMETKFVRDIYEQVIAQSAHHNPMKRNAETGDVVPVMRFLLSDANNFVTGVNIPITGGEEF